MNKLLFYLWSADSIVNLLVYFREGYDFDKLLIALMAGLLAWHNWLEI